MAEPTIFDKIVDGSILSRKVWEDDKFLAFLTPFPNTPGVTVLAAKQNPGDYVFGVDDALVAEMMAAAKKVAKLLEKGLGVSRVGIVFEGTGVPHLHAKLYPLHGTEEELKELAESQHEFHPKYLGHMTTVEGPKMDDAELDAIQAKIIGAAA